MRYVVYATFLILVVLHHDFWYWNDPTLVLGILPIGLTYHILYSILASALWAFAVHFAWPHTLEEEVEQIVHHQKGSQHP